MLFDEIERAETRVKRENESTFSYLNLSARAPMTAARQVFEVWFADYPDSGKSDLRARFRSPIDSQFKSAFWELYLHELFSRLGFRLEPHPDVDASSNHPSVMLAFLLGLFRLVWLFGKDHRGVVLENLALRQQLSIYKHKHKRCH